MKEIERTKPSFMFKSQSSRFDENNLRRRKKEKFEAEVVNKNIYVKVKEGDSLNKSKNQSYVLLKNPISYAGQKVGFNMLSPRFQRDRNKFKPGPGDYFVDDIDFESKKAPKRSKLLSKGMRFVNVKSSGNINTPHSYSGHSTLLKKTFNKLLTPGPED